MRLCTLFPPLFILFPELVPYLYLNSLPFLFSRCSCELGHLSMLYVVFNSEPTLARRLDVTLCAAVVLAACLRV